MRYLFEDYALDTDRRELHRATDVIVVTPQVFDLLDYLIRNRERVVSKDDLINAVWNGRIVSDAALTTRVNAARSAIGDTGETKRLIKTLPRKGFRFVGTVQEAQRLTVEPVSSAALNGGMKPTPNSAPRLSIVVLPFANRSGDPERDYFVDGVTESLTTDLSRISGSFVVGRHTAFSYKDKAIDLRKIGGELNVRYALEGSVQRSANRLRVNVQLVDAESGNHLWAERFDKPIADLFDMQDEIVSRLARALDAQLIVAEARRAERSSHPDVMDLYFQGMASIFQGPNPEYLTQARGFFERALALDPRNIETLVGMAFVDVTIAADLLTDNRAALLSAAETNAIKALSLAPDHAQAHLVLGYVYIFTNHAARGIAECEQALVLNANLAGAHSAIGLAKMYTGRAVETEGHILEAFRLSPRDIAAYWWMYCVGMAKLQLDADADAADWLRRSIETNRNYPLAHFALAAALGLLGALEEGRTAAKAGLALNPGFTIHRLRAAKSSDNPTYLAWRERLYEGLRLVGVREG
ncbi:TolB-like protein/Tfp pilus assembly protein PilF [Bradyrhizobium sp. JR1.5]|uniref:winged helix-turn-helix domain-containing protein n=1 Tax=unclassified Bradyrhizobium TaxID=2631580 RepID=UPI003394F275